MAYWISKLIIGGEKPVLSVAVHPASVRSPLQRLWEAFGKDFYAFQVPSYLGHLHCSLVHSLSPAFACWSPCFLEVRMQSAASVPDG